MALSLKQKADTLLFHYYGSSDEELIENKHYPLALLSCRLRAGNIEEPLDTDFILVEAFLYQLEKGKANFEITEFLLPKIEPEGMRFIPMPERRMCLNKASRGKSWGVVCPQRAPELGARRHIPPCP